MSKKLAGYVSFISNVIAGLVILYYVFDPFQTGIGVSFDEKILLLGIVSLNFSTVFYTMKTKFWKTKLTEIEMLEHENIIIQKKIEQLELKRKLEQRNNN